MGNGAKIGIIIGGFLFLLVGLPLLFASCGKKETPSEEVSAPKKETITLRIWNLYDEEKAFRGTIDRFKSKYRDQYNIIIDYKTFTNEEKYEELLIDAMAAGNGPDIFAMHHSWLPKHKNKIFPAPESLITPEMYRDTFVKVVFDRMIDTDEDGLEQVYGVPMYVDTLALYYNKNIFELIKPEAKTKPEKTWEGIKAQSRAISEPDQSLDRFKRSGIAMGRADNIRHAIDILQMIMAQEKVQLYDDEGNIILHKTQKTPSGRKGKFMRNALSLYTSFDTGWESLHESWNEFITAKHPKDKELGAFVRQKTAMIFGYSGMYNELKELIKEYDKENPIRIKDIGIIEAPQILSDEERGENEFPVYLANFYPLTVSKHSEHPDLAWEFLLDASGADGYSDYNKIIPGRPTALQPEASRSGCNNAESCIDIMAQKADKIYGPFAREVQYSTTFVQFDKKMFHDILVNAIQRAKRRGIEKVVETAAKQLQCVVDQVRGTAKTQDQDCLALQ